MEIMSKNEFDGENKGKLDERLQIFRKLRKKGTTKKPLVRMRQNRWICCGLQAHRFCQPDGSAGCIYCKSG